ncbi:MAG: nickel-responsive transcriptional regulator NikR [Bacteroidales bacterium]|nr:nickel-responsive transcriptional regulator NikR [Bacteroidales bacterium]MBN2698919.1 nickel-responsive transcriptional regulator NikR [Bacteroidales bacterium]
MPIKRFGVSLEKDLLEELDKLVKRELFPNRSQAIRFLIRKNIVQEQWDTDRLVAGAIVIVYDHSIQELHKRINGLQHEYNCLILSGQHIHLDERNCLEVVAVRGSASKLKKLANKFKALKGIRHSELVMSGMD